jgi:hypothetical protein
METSLQHKERTLSTQKLVNPAVRNDKLQTAATSTQAQRWKKWNGKVWQKEGIDYDSPGKLFKGNLQIAKQMAHIPGKTEKQIIDKRKEPSYKALVDEYNLTNQRSSKNHRIPVSRNY